MKKALILAIAGSFFFAFTFVLNRNMNLSGGSWVWSASLRYLITFPIMAVLVWRKHGFSKIHNDIKKNIRFWLLWSTVGFGLFYAPLSFASDHGASWLIAASWQVTIVMGILMAPLFHKSVPIKNLAASGVILIGVFLLQAQSIVDFKWNTSLFTLIPILVAAISYPLGNRKVMSVCSNLSTIERTYAMTLCSLPFWALLSTFGILNLGAPSLSQSFQALAVAVFSGVIATLLFFKATDLVKSNQKKLAVIESTQAGEVIFTLIGGTLLLGDALPDFWGAIGILLIILGMICNSLLSNR